MLSSRQISNFVLIRLLFPGRPCPWISRSPRYIIGGMASIWYYCHGWCSLLCRARIYASDERRRDGLFEQSIWKPGIVCVRVCQHFRSKGAFFRIYFKLSQPGLLMMLYFDRNSLEAWPLLVSSLANTSPESFFTLISFLRRTTRMLQLNLPTRSFLHTYQN